MEGFSRRRALIASTILGAALSPISHASAQQTKAAQTAGTVTQEIVVTAQKRKEALQNVPISISVVGGKELQSPAYANTGDALTSVAGVAANYAIFNGSTMVTIRGVASNSTELAGSSPVAYYLDSVPYGLITASIAPNQDVYDLQRIEILKGPQGTLYGASALAGVVRVLTNDPDLNEFDAGVRVSGSGTDGGSANVRGDMMVNMPIIPGKLAARAVIGYSNESGWIDTAVNDEANFSRSHNYRLKVLAQPTDNLRVVISGWVGRQHSGAPNAGDDDAKTTAVFPQNLPNNFETSSAVIDYDLHGYSLSSQTSYLNYKSDGATDLSAIVHFPFPLITGFHGKVYAEELLVNSPTTGNWLWSIGAMFRRAEENQRQQMYGLPPAFMAAVSGNPEGLFLLQDTVSKSYAGYAQITRLFLDGKVELTGGLRYFHDDVSQEGQIMFPGPIVPTGGSFDKLTPRAALTWHPSHDLTLYASYSRGFRSGFPQATTVASPPLNLQPVKADTLDTYEAGAKGNLFENRVRFELAVYHMKWKNVQETVQVPYLTVYSKAGINGDSASGEGVDFSVTAEPVDGLTLGVNASWNNLTLDAPIISGALVLNEAGTRINYSPAFTGSANISYRFPIGSSGLDGVLSGSVNHTSKQFDRQSPNGTTISPGIGDPMTVARISAAVESKNWTATMFINNLNNWNGAVIREFDIPDYYVRIRPRTIGIQLDYRYR